MSEEELVKIYLHLFDREYMSGVERDQSRVKSTGEVFTPGAAVSQMLDQVPEELFSNPAKNALDPACGDGNWLAEVLWRKLVNGIDFEVALKTIITSTDQILEEENKLDDSSITLDELIELLSKLSEAIKTARFICIFQKSSATPPLGFSEALRMLHPSH